MCQNYNPQYNLSTKADDLTRMFYDDVNLQQEF